MSVKADKALLSKGRMICPSCSKKGLGYAAHPHAYGHKDYGRASCRYCSKRFRIGKRDQTA